MDSNIFQYLILVLNVITFTVQCYLYALENQVFKMAMCTSTRSVIGLFLPKIKSRFLLFNESSLIFRYHVY